MALGRRYRAGGLVKLLDNPFTKKCQNKDFNIYRRIFFPDNIFHPLRVDPTIFDPHFLKPIKFNKYENSSCQYWDILTFLSVKCSNWNVSEV